MISCLPFVFRATSAGLTHGDAQDGFCSLSLTPGRNDAVSSGLRDHLPGKSLSATKSQAKPRLGVKSIPNSEEARSAELCDDRAAARWPQGTVTRSSAYSDWGPVDGQFIDRIALAPSANVYLTQALTVRCWPKNPPLVVRCSRK